MARRTSLNKLDITSQKTFDLWMLRLLCRADVWKDIDTCSLGDADDFGSCFWFKPFRADLHWALQRRVSRNRQCRQRSLSSFPQQVRFSKARVRR